MKWLHVDAWKNEAGPVDIAPTAFSGVEAMQARQEAKTDESEKLKAQNTFNQASVLISNVQAPDIVYANQVYVRVYPSKCLALSLCLKMYAEA